MRRKVWTYMIHTKRRQAGCGRSLRDPHIKGGCCFNSLFILHSSLHFPLPVLLLSRCLSLSLPTLRPLELHSLCFAILLSYSLIPSLSLARFLLLLPLVLFRSAARSLSLLTSHTFTKTLRFQLHTADSYGHDTSSEYGALLMRKTNAYRPPRTKALVATIRRKAGDYAARPSRCDQDRCQTLLDQDCRDENCRQDRHAIVIMLNTYLHIYNT